MPIKTDQTPPRLPCTCACPPQVVFTPHAYPPSITQGTFLGTALWEQCRTAFGYLQTEGACVCVCFFAWAPERVHSVHVLMLPPHTGVGWR
jgi:hypothetical protein